MRYTIQQFVNTVPPKNTLGEGAVYEWQIIDGKFDTSKAAIEYCDRCHSKDIVRVFDNEAFKPVWSNAQD